MWKVFVAPSFQEIMNGIALLSIDRRQVEERYSSNVDAQVLQKLLISSGIDDILIL